MKKKIRRKVGDVVSIPLGDDHYTFGRVLKGRLMAFYDYSSIEEPTIAEIISKPVMFRVWVTDEPIVNGRWPVIGNVPLEDWLTEKVWFYKQDAISKLLTLYPSDSIGEEIPATLEQCRGLENAALWRIMHIESRLQDHFAGQDNKWVAFDKSELEKSK